MQPLVADQTAVVTGASSGNGRAIARTLAEHGADVVVADIQDEPRLGGTPTHEKIAEETSSRATFVDCDVTDVDDLREAVEAAQQYGGVDIMVNNAGIIDYTRFVDSTVEEYEALMDINMKGVYFGSQVAAERMPDAGGSIINIASVDALAGKDDIISYCASKGGVVTMTYALADALGPRSASTLFSPG